MEAKRLSEEEILLKVINILEEEMFELKKIDNITGDVILFDDLGMDSLTFVAVICEIEETFNIEIPEEKMNFDINTTVNDIVKIIYQLDK